MHGKKFDGCRGHWSARKTLPSSGEVHEKGVDGHGGHWWVREALPSPIDNGGLRGKEVDGHRGHLWAGKTSPSLGGAHGRSVDGQEKHHRAVVRCMGRVLMVVEDVGGWGRRRQALLVMV